MNNFFGTWNGEYSFNYGTEEEPDIQYFCFEVRIKEGQEGFTGKFIDQTLRTNNSEIHGFIDDGFLSFVRTSNMENEYGEFLNFEHPNNSQIEFTFNGNFNEQENVFEGVWELVVEEITHGFQEDFTEEIRTGAWYLRKI